MTILKEELQVVKKLNILVEVNKSLKKTKEKKINQLNSKNQVVEEVEETVHQMKLLKMK